ncbi:MAG: YeeE/YedE family protein [Caulobacter sp.]|nr:YeeE/YedE family protein [Caulobacter sp.]
MHPFLQSLAGGVLIGLASAGLLLVNGRIAGISGLLSNAIMLRPGLWRWTFLGGLVAVGIGAGVLGAPVPTGLTEQAPLALAAAGLLVGFGTHLGNGCTSGHGVCGLSNLSLRSLVATAVFMVAAGVTVFISRHGGGIAGLGQ